MKYLLISSAALGAILLFLLATASGNTAALRGHYALLLGLNAALAAALLALVGYQLVRCSAPAARARVRLASDAALAGDVRVARRRAGALVYAVSVQFLAQSIESWFDVRVDAALEGGIILGHTALDQHARRTSGARRARWRWNSPTGRRRSRSCCSTGCASRPASRRRCWSPRAGASSPARAGACETAARSAQRRSAAPGARGARLRRGRNCRRASASPARAGPGAALTIADERAAAARCSRCRRVARDAEAVQAVYRDYQELSLSRQGLKQIYHRSR